MKQVKKWIDHTGAEIPEKYINSQQRLTEKNARKIATRAKSLQKMLHESKMMMLQACKQVFRNTPEAESAKTSFTMFTFNKEFRIEYDLKGNNVRVYEATKPNPSAKDYRLVDMSLSGQNLGVVEEADLSEEESLINNQVESKGTSKEDDNDASEKENNN